MYTYLLINLFAISIPLWRSFDTRISLHKEWKAVFGAIFLTGIPFVLWDALFTKWGVWGFNPNYLSGIYLLGLPLGEWLFFVCIPYACIFTYVALNYFIKHDFIGAKSKWISMILIVLVLSVSVFNYEKAYTVSTAVSLASALVLIQFVFKFPHMGRFYFSYLVILLPFFIVNGILTGTGIEGEVVWYNNAENLGVRLGTIPIEDAFYGMLLILMNIFLFEKLRVKQP